MVRPVGATRGQFPFVGADGGYIGYGFDPQRTVNFYIAQTPGNPARALVTIPGTELAYENGTGDNTRMLYANSDNLFSVFSGEMYRFDAGLTPVALGTLATTQGYVGAASNNASQIMFTDGVNGWVYDYSGVPSFTQITNADFLSFGAPVDVAFIDGFMICVFGEGSPQPNRWAVSSIDDAFTWSALSSEFLTSAGDQKMKGVRVLGSKFYLFGSTVTEIWYNRNESFNFAAVSSETFPFVRDPNTVIPFGCAATASIVSASLPNGQQALVWLASDKTVRAVTGYYAQLISTPSEEQKIERMGNVSDARGYFYRIDGTPFYVLDFPSGALTLSYNFNTQTWTERAMADGGGYSAVCHAYFNNLHYAGHRSLPALLRFEPESAFNFSADPKFAQQGRMEPVICTRVSPILTAPSNERLRVTRVQLNMRQGTGAKTTRHLGGAKYSPYELDPLVILSHSTDGGYEFQQQRTQSAGKVGETHWLTYWDGFLESRKHCFRIDFRTAVKTVVVDMSAQFENLGE